ncbi:hypothetical protein [Gellertiella hungarica]|uniref:Glu-tRNA(Gln) amidotransferase subunit E-like FAD-binding protein n=1 Tax=Gellertiella hungarica TaxID=1572859 RepID=A0A7W6J2P9_9HYPH|nr:hypothetical protein [Gellertiella hungarica]MBB4063689.1 Glu-tRNA(Gln) amidotransferase subunit E-like FAD-binding protein [Gellertiella hungarica]
MKRLLVACLALTAGPAIAGESDDIFLAREIGQVISSADTCGYGLEAEKVKALIRDKVGPMSTNARAMVQASGNLQKNRFASMSDIEKTAACALLEETAKRFGLLK